jgi:hypothetical protein
MLLKDLSVVNKSIVVQDIGVYALQKSQRRQLKIVD